MRDEAFKRLMKLHHLNKIKDEYDGTPLKYKENTTQDELKKKLFAVIDHRIDGNRKLNRYHGTKLYYYLHTLDDKELSENYQILSQAHNLEKESLWETIMNSPNQSVRDDHMHLYLKIAGLKIKDIKEKI